MKLRFPIRGVVVTEDLWDLSVEELDSLFKKQNAKLKVCNEESLLGPKETQNAELGLQVAIVRHIVGVKLEEAEARKTEAEKKAKREKILSIMADKEVGALANKSMDELKKMLDEL